MALPHQCVWCGDDLSPRQISQGGKYCSRACFGEGRRRSRDVLPECLECGEPAPPRQKYCSRSCYYKARFGKPLPLPCVVCFKTLDRSHKIVCSSACREILFARNKSTQEAMRAAQRKVRPRRILCCANCGLEREVRYSWRYRKFCGEKCRREHEARENSWDVDTDAIAGKIAVLGYRAVAMEIGLTKNQLIGRMFKRGYRMRREWLSRCQRGLHNTHKIHAEQAQNAVD